MQPWKSEQLDADYRRHMMAQAERQRVAREARQTEQPDDERALLRAMRRVFQHEK